MCGITGILKKRKTLNIDTTSIIKNMSEQIIHRGPDDYAQFVDENCALAMRRLAIIDLTMGLYPFKSVDGNLTLVFNGEIYNYLILREQLKTLGYQFKTECDAEVIMHGYLEWGNDVFTKLRGMFAIAIWDQKNQKLTLVRDRIGIKPIYYIDSSNTLLFSSEAKSFYHLPKDLYSPSLNYENIDLLLGFMFLPKSSETLLNGIKKLPPATILECQNGTTKLTKYWDIKDIKENTGLTFENAVNELNRILVETIRMHLLSDAPLGVLLSGGIDSSLITAIMVKENLSSRVSTFTAKFDHKFNESDLAKKTAEYLGTSHTEYQLDLLDLNNNIEKYVDIFDDVTTFDGGILTTKILCSYVNKSGIKVLLLGEGADEIFGGYSWFGLSQKPFKFLPHTIRNLAYYYALSRNINHKLLKYASYWDKAEQNSVDVFRDVTRRELNIQLPNHLLMKVDKGSMSESIEARVPYMDHELVEFVYSLPQQFKLKGDWFSKKASNEKYVLREVAKKYLPDDVVFRKKKGFLLPMNDVLSQNKEKIKQYVFSKDALSGNFFTPKQLEALFAPASNFINMQNEYFLWRLFILEVWAQKHKLK